MAVLAELDGYDDDRAAFDAAVDGYLDVVLSVRDSEDLDRHSVTVLVELQELAVRGDDTVTAALAIGHQGAVLGVHLEVRQGR